MSGIAAAKKRRAGLTSPIPEAPRLPNGGIQTPSQQQSQPSQQGLTLQQVIALLDSRITKIEKDTSNVTPTYSQTQPSQELLPSNISEILDDFQQKFVILAGEINSLKDTVLKLQSYTMDVNKILLEERIQILSDIGDNGEDRFILDGGSQPREESVISECENNENISYHSESESFIFHTLDEKND
jgi:hypothetical protein